MRSSTRYWAVLKTALLLGLAMACSPLIKKLFAKRKIWLIGERTGDYLNDNGFHFFRWCLRSAIPEEVYFIVQNSRLDALPKNIPEKNVLIYGSMKHVTYLLFSAVLFYTHTHRDIIYTSLFRIVHHGKKKIFLQHGVSGFKKFNNDYIANAGLPDIVVAVSELERSVLRLAGFSPRSIKVTGFPRHDYLNDTSGDFPPKTIAFLPTWRDWLTAENFACSEFRAQVSAVTGSAAVAEMLERHKLKLKVYLHVNMRQYTRFFEAASDNVEVVCFGSESVDSLISSAHALITDYSSVSWDFLYLGKPVIFFRFDAERYLSERGSYLDFATHTFGISVSSAAELVQSVSNLARDDFKSDAVSDLRARYFAYLGGGNCARLYSEVGLLT